MSNLLKDLEKIFKQRTILLCFILSFVFIPDLFMAAGIQPPAAAEKICAFSPLLAMIFYFAVRINSINEEDNIRQQIMEYDGLPAKLKKINRAYTALCLLCIAAMLPITLMPGIPHTVSVLLRIALAALSVYFINAGYKKISYLIQLVEKQT